MDKHFNKVKLTNNNNKRKFIKKKIHNHLILIIKNKKIRINKHKKISFPQNG